ncbi:MAG: hypothetical protein ACI86H_001180, partial [bacterium]
KSKKQIAVNFLDAQESNLSTRKKPTTIPKVEFNQVTEKGSDRLSPILFLTAILLLIVAWILLRRQSKP